MLKISWNLHFLGKIDWSMNSKGCLKKLFYFQKTTKNCNKVATIHKAEKLFYISVFQIVPTLLPFFVEILKWFFFIYPSFPTLLTVRNSFTHQFYQNKFSFWIYPKKSDKFFWDPSLHFSFALFFGLKISRNFNLFGKIDLSMTSGRWRARDSWGY